MKTYYLQEKVNNKWITREESNSREILVANQCLDYENIETRIIPVTEIKLTEEEIFEILKMEFNKEQKWTQNYIYMSRI